MIASEIADALNKSLSGIDKLLSAKKVLQPGSLIELSQASRVIAPCIYEQNLWFTDAQKPLVDTIRTAENMYTGFYLLALNAIMPVGSIDVDKTLGRLNPNRNEKVSVGKLILESADKDLVFLDSTGKPPAYADANSNIEMLNNDSNIVTGKYLTVTLTDGSATVKMPLSIRMRTARARSEIMEALLSIGGAQNSFKTRWHRMMAGEIGFWDDLIWSSDLVRQQKKLMKMDEEGVLKAVQTARLRAMKSAAATNVQSSGAIASTYIISAETKARIERTTGRSLTNFAVRQKLMEESLAMQLAIIDTREQMVTFYFHSIEEGTVASFSQLEKGGKKGDSGADLLSILQALRTGNVPQIR